VAAGALQDRYGDLNLRSALSDETSKAVRVIDLEEGRTVTTARTGWNQPAL